MNEVMKIGNSEILVKEWNGQRVVTLHDIDVVHGRPDGTARRNFNTNKSRFIEGEDYFIVSADEIRTSHVFPISESDFMNKALITEQGYLMLVKSFTDNLAWTVQRELVKTYFNVRQIVCEELSPEMQLLMQMVNKMAKAELAHNKLQEQTNKIEKSVDNIKEAVRPVFDNWREEINRKFNHIQKNTDTEFQFLRAEMYRELEQRAGCKLDIRLSNLIKRKEESGASKTQIKALNKMDVIEEDKKLREIFGKIVSEYEIKHCA